jgi:hypothetical protein
MGAGRGSMVNTTKMFPSMFGAKETLKPVTISAALERDGGHESCG